jgi:O-antigen ligase
MMSVSSGTNVHDAPVANGARERFWDWSFVLPLVWIMVSSSRGFGVFETRAALEAVETEALQGSPEGFLYSALVLAGILLLVRSRFDWRDFIAANPVLVLLYLLILASVLWSEVPFITLKRFIKTVGVLVMVVVLLHDAGTVKVVRFLILFVGGYLVWSLVYILFFPSLGVGFSVLGERELIGIAHTKNSLAQVALAGCLVFGYSVFLGGRRKILSLLFLGGCLACIIIADSMTCLFLGLLSILGFLVYRATLNSRMEFRSLTLVLTVVLGAVSAFFLLTHSGEGALSRFLSEFNRDVTLTGRVDLWEDVLAIANETWLLGKGYGAFWYEGMENALWDIYVWQPNQAHQGFLDIYLQLGVVGLGLTLVWIVRVLGRLIGSSLYDPFEAFRLLFIVILLIHNLVESSLLRLNHLNWFLFLLMALASFGVDSAEFRTPESSGTVEKPAESAEVEE